MKQTKLTYLDLKRAIDHTEQEIQNMESAALVSRIVLERLKQELTKYPEPKPVKEPNEAAG